MPTNRRSRTREKLTIRKLTIAIRGILSTGYDFVGDLDHLSPMPRNRYGQVEQNLWAYIKGMYPPCLSDAPEGSDARLDFLREEWEKHKSEVMVWHLGGYRNGSRPWGWWMWDAPEPYPHFRPDGGSPEDHYAARKKQELQAIAILLRHGLLSAEEEHAIREQAAELERLRARGPGE